MYQPEIDLSEVSRSNYQNAYNAWSLLPEVEGLTKHKDLLKTCWKFSMDEIIQEMTAS
jgi:hypothetical protein